MGCGILNSSNPFTSGLECFSEECKDLHFAYHGSSLTFEINNSKEQMGPRRRPELQLRKACLLAATHSVESHHPSAVHLDILPISVASYLSKFCFQAQLKCLCSMKIFSCHLHWELCYLSCALSGH